MGRSKQPRQIAKPPLDHPPIIQPDHPSNYIGYVPSQVDTIERVNASIDPVDFYARYVRPRKPCILTGALDMKEWATMARLADVEHLRSAARDALVKAEPLNPATGSFGSGMARTTMAFPALLDLLLDPATAHMWYLTTQYDDEDDNPIPDDDEERLQGTTMPKLDPVCPSPTDKLDVPTQPSIMGNLVLQQCNIWIGNSPIGSSSGLHHDFHDNLYTLLRGHKRFVLFPPSAHSFLHLRGRVSHLHPNGLISYHPSDASPSSAESSPDMSKLERADGLDPLDAAIWRVRYWEKKTHLAGHESDTGGTRRRLDEALAQLEDISAVMDHEEELDDDSFAQVLEHGAELFDILDNNEEDDGDEESDDDDEDEEEAGGFTFGAGEDDGGDSDLELALQQATKGDVDAAGTKPEPPSFSRIPPAALHDHLGIPSHPRSAASLSSVPAKSRKRSKKQESSPLPGCPHALVAELVPGEMLYLPASWMHEVTSAADAQGGPHIAFNYWFHPPDGQIPPKSSPSSDLAKRQKQGAKLSRPSSKPLGSFDRPYSDHEVWTEIGLQVQVQMQNLAAARRQDGADASSADDEVEWQGITTGEKRKAADDVVDGIGIPKFKTARTAKSHRLNKKPGQDDALFISESPSYHTKDPERCIITTP